MERTVEYRNPNLRFRYGVCNNAACPMCKSKKIQRIPIQNNLVCYACGRVLRECPPPKQSNTTAIIVGILLLSITICGVVGFCLWGGIFNHQSTTERNDSVTTDSVAPAVVETPRPATETRTRPVTSRQDRTTETIEQETAVPTPKAESTGTVTLDYGEFTGTIKDGQPNGQGRMKFISPHAIDNRDPKARVAESGDYIIGEWKDGKLIQGRWYDKDGNVKGSVIIGM